MGRPSVTPSRFPNGVGSVYPKHLLANLSIPDPMSVHQLADDFNSFNTNLWTLTGVGTPAAAEINTSAGGVVALTTTTGGSDSAIIQAATALFAVATNAAALYFREAFYLSDVLACSFIAGLVNLSLTGVTPTNGMYFSKANGSAALNFNVAVGGVVTTVATGITLVNATELDIGCYSDGNGNYYAFAGPTGQPTQVAVINNLVGPTAFLAPTTGLLNGAAAAKTLDVNFIFVSKQRPTLPVA